MKFICSECGCEFTSTFPKAVVCGRECRSARSVRQARTWQIAHPEARAQHRDRFKASLRLQTAVKNTALIVDAYVARRGG